MNMNGQIGKGGNPMLWGFPLEFWNSVIVWSLIVACLTGGVAVISGFVAGFVGWKVSDLSQKEADIKVAEAGKKASEANERAAQAEARAAEANLALEKFKLPRRLTKEQDEALAKAMELYTGTIVEISGTDNESLGFGISISNALVKAGWKRRTWTGGGQTINLPGESFKAGHVMDDGIHIRIFTDDLRRQKDSLVKFLNDAGFKGVKETSILDLPVEHPSKKSMHIMVGTKM